MPTPPECCTLTGMDHGSRGLSPPARRPAATWVPPGIVGREAELRQIDEYVDTLESGPRSILLIGEAGIGKTTLWNYGLGRCRAHHRQVLVTRASQDDHQVLGQGLLDLFDPRHLPDDLAPLALGPDLSALECSRLVLDRLQTLAARGPVVIAVDDLPWLDDLTLRVLRFSLRRLVGEPVSLLATLRTWLPDTLATVIPDLGGMTRVLRVRGLETADLRSIVCDRIPALDGASLKQIDDLAEGNPLFAIALARARAGSAPLAPDGGGPLAALARRLAGLAADTLLLARLLSVAGPTSLPVLRAAVGLVDDRPWGRDRLDDALRDGLEAETFTLDQDFVLRFAHPLIATAVLDGMNALDSRNLHAALAEVVSDRGARAVHLARAVVDPDGAVADEIEEAALRLSRRGSPRMAAELMGHSARLTPHHAIEQRVRRTLAQVMQSATAGNLPAALALAATLLDQLEPGRLRAEVITGRVVLDPSDAEQLLRRALEDVPADGPPEYECLRGRLLGLLGWLIALHLGRVHEGLEYARAGLEIGRTEGDVVLVAQAASAVSTASLLIGRRADELMDEACRLDSEVVASQLALWPKVLQGRQQLWDGRIREARANLDAMYKCAVAAGAECQRSYRLCDLAHLELAAGDLDVAQRYVDEGLEAALDCGDERAVSWLAYPGGLIGALRGDVDGVAWSAERLDWWAARAGERPRTSMAAHVRGVLAASQGDWESGLGHLMTAQSILDAMGVRHPGMVPALPLAIQLAGLADQPDRVEALVAKLARRCAGLGSPWADLQLRAATGHLQLLREEQAALATLQASHLGLTRLGYGLDAARLGCLVVASGLRAGGRRDVLPVAEATFETFRRNGVRGWDAVAADLLERVRGCGSGALTATEQQVATLVAAGGRNREVASALFVSESTVEAHLTRIYRKLGLRNRAELAQQVSIASA